MYLTPLRLPPANLKLTREAGVTKVRCLIRNRRVLLTPEEWVRQHLLSYLISHLDYPKGYIAVEFSLKYNGSFKRCDILVIDHVGNPLLIVECKAPEIKITQHTFFQVAKYNNALNASNLLVTNGLTHLFFSKSTSNHELIVHEEILSWKDITAL